MPVNKTTLKKRTKRYTMQDYYDGKCSKEGFTLDTVGATSFKEDEAAKNAPPEQEATSEVGPSPVADETQPEASEPQAASDEPTQEVPKEGE